MTTSTSSYTNTHSVTFVADKLLMCLQEIVRLSGLDPKKISEDWGGLERGLSSWLESGHLEAVTLEVFLPLTDKLVDRWDFEIRYDWTGEYATFWVDTDQIRYALQKKEVLGSLCDYRIVVTTKAGRPDVEGWTNAEFRSTEGFIRQSVGTTLDAGGLGASAHYYRKK